MLDKLLYDLIYPGFSRESWAKIKVTSVIPRYDTMVRSERRLMTCLECFLSFPLTPLLVSFHENGRILLGKNETRMLFKKERRFQG